jgi:V8-like Glu-specific endopeptidase
MKDDRRAVGAGDPALNYACRLRMFAPGVKPGPDNAANFGCGVLIGPDLVLTVAHNLYDPELFGGSGFAGAVEVRLGHGLGPGAVRQSTRMAVPPGYVDPATAGAIRRGLDVGVVRLDQPLAGAPPLLGGLPDATLANASAEVYGHSAEHGFALVRHSGPVVGLAGLLFYHRADTARGQSGGAVIVPTQQGPALAGLQRAGFGETPAPYAPANGAVRFGPQLRAWAEKARQEI